MKKEKHIYTTKIDPDTPLLPVHGVVGGVTQSGSLEVLFYTEQEVLPAPASVLTSEDGTIVNEEDVRQEQEEHPSVRRFTRQVHSRFQLTESQTRHLISWLMSQVEVMAQANQAAAAAQRTSGPRS